MIDKVELAKAVGTIVHIQCNDMAFHYDQVKASDTFLIEVHVYGLLCHVTDDFITVTQQAIGDEVRNAVCIPFVNIQYAERVVAMRELPRMDGKSWTELEDTGEDDS